MDIIYGFKETFNDLLDEKELTVKKLSEELNVSPFVILKWKNKNVDPKLKTLLLLADYFQCSIEFLCGKTKVYLDYMPKECPCFADWLPVLLKNHHKTSYQLFRDTTIKTSQYHYWRKGSEPLLSSLQVLSEFCGTTIDCVIGRDRNG